MRTRALYQVFRRPIDSEEHFSLVLETKSEEAAEEWLAKYLKDLANQNNFAFTRDDFVIVPESYLKDWE